MIVDKSPSVQLPAVIAQGLEKCTRGWFTWTGIGAESNRKAVQQLVADIRDITGKDLTKAPWVGARVQEALQTGGLLDTETIERIKSMTLGARSIGTETIDPSVPNLPINERLMETEKTSIQSTPRSPSTQLITTKPQATTLANTQPKKNITLFALPSTQPQPRAKTTTTTKAPALTHMTKDRPKGPANRRPPSKITQENK